MRAFIALLVALIAFVGLTVRPSFRVSFFRPAPIPLSPCFSPNRPCLTIPLPLPLPPIL